MSELLWVAYAVSTTVIPTVVIYMLATSYRRSKGYNGRKESLAALLILAVYVGLVFFVTGSGTLYDFLRAGFEYRPDEINVIPLLLDSYTMQYVLNVILFVPFGVLLPLVTPSLAKIRHIFGYGLGFSLCIELSQLLNRRATDVDDLIMNVLGALIGFLLLMIVRKIGKKKSFSEEAVIPDEKTMPAFYMAGMFLGYFFLYNGLGLAVFLAGN